ncbi:MAG: hypothetical protein ACE5FA_07610 [Dehalococcoidia bacterium]
MSEHPSAKKRGGWLSRLLGRGAAERKAPSRDQRGASVTKQLAFLGRTVGAGTELTTECLRCRELVTLRIAPAPIRGERPQVVMQHVCVHCGAELFALTLPDNRAFLCERCWIADGLLRHENAVLLDIAEGAQVVGGGHRCKATPLTVGRGRDGQPALLSPDDLGLSPP